MTAYTSITVKMYDLDWPVSEIQGFFAADIREISLLMLHSVFAAVSTATKCIKRNKHSISIEIYSGVALFPCDSGFLVLKNNSQ